MAELKSCFIELGCANVLTHLNSGNIIFSIDERDELVLADKIKAMIQERFDLYIPVIAILQEELKDLLSNSPAWWETDDKEIYDNLIFVIPSTTAKAIAKKIGKLTKELEQICICKNAIFWSFDRKNMRRRAGGKKQQAQEVAK